MAFLADLQQWATPHAFAAYLARYDPAVCGWVRRIVVHHTYKPAIDDWRGMRSLLGAKRYYEGLGWDDGPHLFIATGSPNPAHDGVFQLTPLNHIGNTHSNRCNPDSIAVEVVGNYDPAPWPEALRLDVVATLATFMRWRGGLLPSALVGHRDCGSRKTCPGRSINMDHVRVWVGTALRTASDDVKDEGA